MSRIRGPMHRHNDFVKSSIWNLLKPTLALLMLPPVDLLAFLFGMF